MTTLARGDRATVAHPISLAYGSHAAGWTHRLHPAGTIVTVTRLTRWSVEVVGDDGGTTTLPGSHLTPAPQETAMDAECLICSIQIGDDPDDDLERMRCSDHSL